jgi:prefoldin subunit 5
VSYKPFTTEYTYQIIDDIKEYLEETNKDQTTLDTLDLCHLIGEIERLNKQIEEYQKTLDETISKKIDLENIIKEVREYIEHENFKRTVLVGVSTKKYTRDILNKVLEILEGEK